MERDKKIPLGSRRGKNFIAQAFNWAGRVGKD
jgi:hypothetical protein